MWKAVKVVEMQVRQSTSTLERSLHSKDTDRVHFHWKVNLLDPLDCAGTAVFAFHGVRPDARASVVTAATKQARGANVAEASNRGHFYVWAPILGVPNPVSLFLRQGSRLKGCDLISDICVSAPV